MYGAKSSPEATYVKCVIKGEFYKTPSLQQVSMDEYQDWHYETFGEYPEKESSRFMTEIHRALRKELWKRATSSN